ncbi:MAG TPA: bifunctional [glutamate--ammonia ligase]-adenylyl-L-tyrosine phosphorylase/[glutamate--ammonia-ligase] adenylyltransferase [Candidatus Latescibacteria bacterium]|nr:bifunctional [glutamate--ammonia ligase]-adenylyl-L-tyrosine phosphorylase/[glutamate--ammonia-ligase] adenylyltransferase [Candidatus Latescibacterota bacterium]
MPDPGKTLRNVLLGVFPELSPDSCTELFLRHFPPPQERVSRAIEIFAQSLPPRIVRLLVETCAASPDPGAAISCLSELVQATPSAFRGITLEQARRLALFLSGGAFLRERILRHAGRVFWLVDESGRMFSRTELEKEIAETREGDAEWDALRVWHDLHLMRIAVADCACTLDIAEITEQLSLLAEVTINEVAQRQAQALRERYGNPLQQDGADAEWCVIGLGKLGGSELNFRSDVDVMFVYSADGYSTGGTSGAVPVAQWYNRWAEGVLSVLTEVSSTGLLYRVDTRLRPDGQSGALVRSIASYVHYYEQRGEVWERQMLVKARPVAGSVRTGQELLDFLESFIYPRSLVTSPREEIHRVKNRILQHLEAKTASSNPANAERNLKLGRGGLRDIEFVVQCLQLVVGGSDKAVRERNTLAAIRKLHQRGVLSDNEQRTLDEAYRLFRRTEHRLQMATGQPSFVLPSEHDELTLLARRMGYSDPRVLTADLEAARKAVMSVYDSVLGPPETGTEIGKILSFLAGDSEAISKLAGCGFHNPEAAHRNLLHLAFGHGDTVPASAPSPPVLRLVPRLLDELRVSANPDRGLNNVERMLRAFGAVDSFADLLSSHNAFLNLLVTIAARSEALTETISRDPGLVDWMLYSGVLFAERHPEDVDLESRAAVAGLPTTELRTAALHSFRKRENLRVGVRFLLGLANEEETSEQLTAIAESVVKRVVSIASRSLAGAYADNPSYQWAIIGLGKLGGREMNFGSDLDIFFIHSEDQGESQCVDYVTSLAQEVLRLLSENTEYGILYEVDTRLRPEGKHGPLSLSIDGFREYLRKRAAQWERQALTFSRVIVSGPQPHFGEVVEEAVWNAIAVKPTREIFESALSMRLRMQEQAQSNYGTRQNIKTGFGGLVDAEFIAQLGRMIGGVRLWEGRKGNTRATLECMQSAGLLPDRVARTLMDAYRALRRIQMHLRVNDYRAHNVLPEDEDAILTLARGLGFRDRSDLSVHVEKVTEDMRGAFLLALEFLAAASMKASGGSLV